MIATHTFGKHKKAATFAAKVVLLIAVIVAVVYHIASQGQTYSIFSVLSGSKELLLLGLAVAGMPVNRFIEAVKWHNLICVHEKISLKSACYAILSGCSVSLLLPNRIGESAGRMMYVSADKRTEAVVTTTAAGFSQLTATLVFGLIALPFYLRETQLIPQNAYIAVLSGCFMITAAGIFLYFNLSKLARLDTHSFFQNKYLKKASRAFGFLNFKTALNLLFLSLLRYVVFALQFVAVLYVFVPDIPLHVPFIAVSVIYLATTLIPSFTLAELGIRESASVFLLAPFTAFPAGVAAAAFFLWILNIAVPAAFGAFLSFADHSQRTAPSCT